MNTRKRLFLTWALVSILFVVGTVAAQVAPSPVGNGLATTAPAAAPPHAPADEFFKFYAANLRSIFFSGCLTLSSFLLAATTFIVINLKKEVYDSPGYREKVLGAKTGTTHYGPLRRLSRLLIFNIALALTASVLQVTVGILWEARGGAIVCIAAVASAIFLLFLSLTVIGLNLHDWFNHMEQQLKKAV